MNLQVLYKLRQWQIFEHLTDDVNLRRRFIVVRTIINITAAAAVTVIFPRIFFAVIGVFSILSFGRRLRSFDAFPSHLFLNQLKRTNEKTLEILRRKMREFKKTQQIIRETNLVQLSTGDILRNLLPAGELEFPWKFSLDSQDVFVGANS
jgi:hypothetical protein